MKTIESECKGSSNTSSNGVVAQEAADLLSSENRNNQCLTCNYKPDTISSSIEVTSFLEFKNHLSETAFIERSEDLQSHSMPHSVGNSLNGRIDVTNCDIKTKLLIEHKESPKLSPENWFKTWPERCDQSKPNLENMRNGDISKVNNKVTFNEALQNISLAYSPVTKQLHLLTSEEESNAVDINDDIDKKPGHRRTEAGSFSSTISSLTDQSSSGSLLDAEDRISMLSNDTDFQCNTGCTSTNNVENEKNRFSNFFNRNMFLWKPSSSVGGWKIFKSTEDTVASTPGITVSSSALIQHIRPSNLPAKTAEEDERHRKEYKAILLAAKKKEAKNSVAKQKQQKLQLQLEEQLASATKHFANTVLPNWDAMSTTRKTRDLWWQGLPSSVRGRVWRMAIGNELNLTQQLYEICLQRAQHRLNSSEPSGASNLDQESSMDVIQLDISRTFPNLCIFQEGGPYSEVLHSLLAAYVCYRPDVGYVQGMSFIAAILILNMDEVDAFLCFANLLNRPLHLAAFTLNQIQMQAYYNAYNEIFSYNLIKLYNHFQKSGLSPDLYLLDWIYTVFAKAMPLDVACRVWDVFLRDGDEFLFRAALGILHLHQDLLLDMDFLHGAQFLTRLPDDLSADLLFKSIQGIYTSIGKQTFSQIVERCKLSDL